MLFVALLPTSAPAQSSHFDRSRLMAHLGFAMAGGVTFRADAAGSPSGQVEWSRVELDAATDVGVGGGLRVVFPMGSFVELGLDVGACSWVAGGSDSGAPRSVVTDAGGHLGFVARPNETVRAYVILPGGLSLGFLPDATDLSAFAPGAGKPPEVSVGTGAHFGVVFGVEVALSPGVGGFVEAGWLYRSLAHRIDFEDPARDVDQSRDVTVTLHEGVLRLGISFDIRTRSAIADPSSPARRPGRRGSRRGAPDP